MNDNIRVIECEEAIRRMLEYIDNELHDHDHEEMQQHLDSCRECYTRMEFEQRLKGMVHEARDQKAPPGLNNRIKNIIKKY